MCISCVCKVEVLDGCGMGVVYKDFECQKGVVCDMYCRDTPWWVIVGTKVGKGIGDIVVHYSQVRAISF